MSVGMLGDGNYGRGVSGRPGYPVPRVEVASHPVLRTMSSYTGSVQGNSLFLQFLSYSIKEVELDRLCLF